MGSSAKLLPKCFEASTPKKQKSWRIRAELKTQFLPLNKVHYSASKFLKIHICNSKVDTDAVLDGHTISQHFLSRKRDQPDARNLPLRRASECIFHKENVNKLTSVLHRVWSIEKTTLQKPNFSKNAQICVETFETARRAPLGESPEGECFRTT